MGKDWAGSRLREWMQMGGREVQIQRLRQRLRQLAHEQVEIERQISGLVAEESHRGVHETPVGQRSFGMSARAL
jgi:hypothetical protein